MAENRLARALASQMLASIRTLKDCVDRCPDAEWNERQGDYPFSQVVFHALFDLDLCLSSDEGGLKGQEFHLLHGAAFEGYEELAEGARTRLYGREFLGLYLGHCLARIGSVVEAADDASLLIPNSDYYGSMTRCERYVNAIRHLQHHAAQLGLRLQWRSGVEMAWIGRGY